MEILPKTTKIFFSDNGSTAVEVAIKVALQYFFNKGQRKRQ
jgi:adenosylmethionine-8-amino-7-oxononanoate aminotransferase